MRGQTPSFPSPNYRCWLCCLQVEGAHPDPVEAGTKLSDVRESDHIRGICWTVWCPQRGQVSLDLSCINEIARSHRD